MAVFYRGILRDQTGDYRGAEQDITRVLEEYPQFTQGYQMRSEVREKLGNHRGAQEDAMVVLQEQNRRFNNAMGYASGDDGSGEPAPRSRRQTKMQPTAAKGIPSGSDSNGHPATDCQQVSGSIQALPANRAQEWR